MAQKLVTIPLPIPTLPIMVDPYAWSRITGDWLNWMLPVNWALRWMIAIGATTVSYQRE